MTYSYLQVGRARTIAPENRATALRAEGHPARVRA